MDKKRILIVEDDELLNDNYRAAFAKVPEFVTDIALNVDQARKIIAQNQPDLIVLDLLLPGDVGTSLLKELKEQGLTDTIPVLVATNLENTTLISHALQLGAKDYFVKSDVQVEDIVENCKTTLRISNT